MTSGIYPGGHSLSSDFYHVRETLHQEKYRNLLTKALGYWAHPDDRRLPLALLDRTIGDLLQTPFQELCATPGIGLKKMKSLLILLKRAASEPLDSLVLNENHSPAPTPSLAFIDPLETFNPETVSEAIWSGWRETVRRHAIGHKTLGRLAPSLQRVPTVMWHTSLNYYLNYTLNEIRNLKRHGDKRINVVLEVFHVANSILGNAGTQPHLQVSLMPHFIVPLRAWLNEVIRSEDPPSIQAIDNQFAIPLLRQIRVDADPLVSQLAGGRIGVGMPQQSVQTQAKQAGVTRARVYQLLGMCGKIMAVRWPEGSPLLKALIQKIESQQSAANTVSRLREICELFFSDQGPSLENHQPLSQDLDEADPLNSEAESQESEADSPDNETPSPAMLRSRRKPSKN